jgi:hypothetical protein
MKFSGVWICWTLYPLLKRGGGHGFILYCFDKWVHYLFSRQIFKTHLEYFLEQSKS